jgi:hypothetical protein
MGTVTGKAAIALMALTLATLPGAARAGTSPSGNLSIEARLDPDRVAPGEAATLTVQISSAGLNLPSVAVPSLRGALVEAAGSEQGLSIVNGRATRTATTVYRIIPKSEGTIPIPPFSIGAGNERAQSDPLTLTVTHNAGQSTPPGVQGNLPPGSAPTGTPEIFVKAIVDRPRAYWNEQVTLRLRLYSRVDVLGDVDWKPPSANGFWTESLGPPRQGRVRLNGAEYAVMEIPTALFPTRTGSLTIGPATIRCRVARVIQPPDPWSMLAMPDVVPQDVSLRSNPVTITVDPLPSGAPAGFQGAVGAFHLAFHVDGLVAHTGEPVTARATIAGTGNVPSIRDPEIHARGASREYVVSTSSKLDRANDKLSGEREHDVAFVSDAPGTLEILPVTFVWFDPEARSYRWQSSEAVTVRVVPDSTGGAGPAPAVPGGLAIAAPRQTSGPRGSLTLDPTPASLALFGGSVLLFGAALLAGRDRRRRERDPRWMRLRALTPLLDRDLALAESRAKTGEPAAAAALAAETLRKGTGLRHDVEMGGLARADRERELAARGAPPAQIAELETLFDALAAIAYAPPETRRADAKQAIAGVRRTLERYRKELLA